MFISSIIKRLKKAPSKALNRNTLEGENLSAMVKIAKVSVPVIKPNCTAEVK